MIRLLLSFISFFIPWLSPGLATHGSLPRSSGGQGTGVTEMAPSPVPNSTGPRGLPSMMTVPSFSSRIKIINRIRVVYLNENNRVETLAGTGVAGMKNGNFSEAQFNRPVALAYLTGNKLAIVDSRNYMFRLLDLKAQTVSTLAGTGTRGTRTERRLNPPWTPSGTWFTYPTKTGSISRSPAALFAGSISPQACKQVLTRGPASSPTWGFMCL